MARQQKTIDLRELTSPTFRSDPRDSELAFGYDVLASNTTRLASRPRTGSSGSSMSSAVFTITASGNEGTDATTVSSGGNFENAAKMRRSSASFAGNEIFVRGSLQDRNIEAVALIDVGKTDEPKDYRGRNKIWPGILLLLAFVATAGCLTTYYASKVSQNRFERIVQYQRFQFEKGMISGKAEGDIFVRGIDGDNGDADQEMSGELVDDDGTVGNPKLYPESQCELPNYLSKNGRIVAVSANGTEVPLQIKGVNWFGMETGEGIPLGLWENNENGTNAYQIARFLAANNFNAVRLPLMASWLLDNDTEPNVALLNTFTNRGIAAKSYVSLLRSLVKALQFRGIGVLLSMHTLTATENGKLWYSTSFPEERFLAAIGVLTDSLCSHEYWNVMGVDLKNEPYGATWGPGKNASADFRAGAQRIANKVLAGCPSWLGFVEGVNGYHDLDIDGESFRYGDWYGGGLQGARKLGLEFSVAQKVVWAPHYYTPAVFPQQYFYGGGQADESGAISEYVELDDATLRRRISATMDDMFGFLATETGPALLLGEFGGLYSKDAHPQQTTKRCTDFCIEKITQPNWAGGFVWSLNPESAYQFNPADTTGDFTEGLVADDWLDTNGEFLSAMSAMDDMVDLHRFPCFSVLASSAPSGVEGAQT